MQVAVTGQKRLRKAGKGKVRRLSILEKLQDGELGYSDIRETLLQLSPVGRQRDGELEPLLDVSWFVVIGIGPFHRNNSHREGHHGRATSSQCTLGTAYAICN